MHLGAGDVDGRRQEVKVVDLDDDVGRRAPAEQDVVQRALERIGIGPGRPRETGLRVEIDEQRAQAALDERSPERVDGRGLRDAALLIGDGDDPSSTH